METKTHIGLTHVFTNRTADSLITLKAGSGETLNIPNFQVTDATLSNLVATAATIAGLNVTNERITNGTTTNAIITNATIGSLQMTGPINSSSYMLSRQPAMFCTTSTQAYLSVANFRMMNYWTTMASKGGIETSAGGYFIVPVTGWYQINYQLGFNVTDIVNLQIGILFEASTVIGYSQLDRAGTNIDLTATYCEALYLTAGNLYSMYIYAAGGTGYTIPDARLNRFSLYLLP